ncbi:hypothetical protein CPT_Shady_070 [Streptomyces phage Shady]|uniref:Uncharacterized protein n=1 Tax=Streptomyces phage Shady TaxID=2767585 RepID=A0A873WQ84_9CAUD|nr:hypothetical protein CPT_Shady_070 [Streptomyces phage Shady]
MLILNMKLGHPLRNPMGSGKLSPDQHSTHHLVTSLGAPLPRCT